MVRYHQLSQRSRRGSLAVFVLLFLQTTSSHAQEFADEPSTPVQGPAVIDLRNGGTLSGNTMPYRSDQIDGQLITFDSGLLIAISDAIVNRIRHDDAKLTEYQTLLEKMRDVPEDHWKMVQWCQGASLYPQKERHLRRVIELDPNHGPARQELGFMPLGNKWVKRDSFMRSRGMVREKGKWRFAEEVAAMDEGQQIDDQRKEWLKKIPALKTQAVRSGPKSAEALAQLQNINDPAADEAVVKEYVTGKDAARFPPRLWLEILTRLRTPMSVQTLIRASLEDTSETNRQLCFDALNEYGKYQAISVYLSLLRDQDNTVVRRAGRALIEVNDPEIALELVEALRTKHRYESAPGNDTNVAMTPNGQGSTQFGNKRVVIVKEQENPEVLTTLRDILGEEEDVDYLYDEARWRRHFALRLGPPTGDLRRDP